jgi:hypothetical protein
MDPSLGHDFPLILLSIRQIYQTQEEVADNSCPEDAREGEIVREEDLEPTFEGTVP